MKALRGELSRAPEFLRWRRPLYVLLLGLRELLRPVMYWYVFDIFATEIRMRIPDPYSKDAVVVRIYSGTSDLNNAMEELAGMDGLASADIKLRLRRGDVVAVAYSENRVAGAMWLTFSNGMELAFGTGWIIGPGEALRYDSFVRRDFRGRGIHSSLNQAINAYALDHGISKNLGGISVLNSQSLSLPKHSKTNRVMRLFLFRLRGLNWTYRSAIGAPWTSRFDLRPRFKTRVASTE